MIFALIFGIIILLLVLYLHVLNKEIKEMGEQIEFLSKNDSRLNLTSRTKNSNMNRLIAALNDYFKQTRDLRKNLKIQDETSQNIIVALSHDIRTPLTSLQGYIQLLNSDISEEDRQRYIQVIEKRLETLQEILDQLFTYTKLENKLYEFDLEKLDIREELAQVLFSFYDDFQQKEIEALVDLPEEEVYILGQKEALNRVILNIIKNALDHGKDKVWVVLTYDSEVTTLRISNQVESTDTIDLDQVFNQFYKASKARNHSSTGLGLYIAKELTTLQGGQLKASFEDTMFSLELTFKRCLGDCLGQNS